METETDRNTEKQIEILRETDRETSRETERDRQKDRDRETKSMLAMSYKATVGTKCTESPHDQLPPHLTTTLLTTHTHKKNKNRQLDKGLPFMVTPSGSKDQGPLRELDAHTRRAPGAGQGAHRVLPVPPPWCGHLGLGGFRHSWRSCLSPARAMSPFEAWSAASLTCRVG